MNIDTELKPADGGTPPTSDLRPPTSALPEGITQAELDAHHARQERLTRGAAATFPGPLREAFAGNLPEIHGFKFQPFRVGTLALLERIKSPFVPMMKILADNSAVVEGESPADRSRRIYGIIETKLKPTADQLIEAIFILVTPTKMIRELLDRGLPAFSAAAQEKIGDAVTPLQFNDLEAVAMAHFLRAYSTLVEYEADTSGSTSFPLPPTAPATGSAGGSASSAP
jgi:hypothetical protein